MSLHDYLESKELSKGDPGFYSLIMAAMRKADTSNAGRLMGAFPHVWAEMQNRYDAPGGRLPTDPPERR